MAMDAASSADDAENLDIHTVGSDDHLQRRNKLKGTAMQKLILRAIGCKDDQSIKKILEEISPKAQEYYIVLEPFRVGSKVFRTKYEFVHVDEFPTQFTAETHKRVEDKTWKVCSNPDCGIRIPAKVQFSKKCRKCKKGFFRFEIKKLSTFEPLITGNRAVVLNKLVAEGQLKQVTNLTKRADFFEYNEGVFYIFESKNKELTGLQFEDVGRSLIYPILLKRCGYEVSDLEFIFNGFFSDELHEAIMEGYAKKFRFNFRFRHITHFLRDKGVVCKGVRVTTEDGENYRYEIVEGESKQMTIWIEKPSKRSS